MSITYIPFSTFHDQVKDEYAPEGLAENLLTPFRSWVSYGLAQAQQYVHWYRSFNARFITKGDVNEFCGTSIFQGPAGKITQLFAYKPSIDCKRLHYKRVSTAEVDCWMGRQRCLCPADDPPRTDIYLSPYCNYVIPGEDACAVPYMTATEDDCRFKSLDDDVRIFAVGPDYKVFAAPRFPCEYNLLLQWQGINRKWNNNDVVHEDDLLREVVVNYVEHKAYMKENQGKVSGYYEAFVAALRDLKKRWSDEQDTPEERDCTAAVAQLMATFQPLYASPVYGPGETQTWLTEGGQTWILE